MANISTKYSTWLEIDLGAITYNVQRLKSIAGTPLMAVVKANGYGHGLAQAARASLRGGAAWLAVARLEEAMVLREAGIQAPVLVLGYTETDRIQQAVNNDIRLAVFDPRQAEAFSNAASGGKKLKVHAKIDSGMGRLGVLAEEGADFVHGLQRLAGLEVEGLFTHFARADEPERSETVEQIQAFDQVVKALESSSARPAIVHACNSAGTLYFPQAHYDMVRCGISIYGLHPDPRLAPNPSDFRPALSWKARLASVKLLPAGHGVGYGHRYHTSTEEHIGVIPVGYADGFRRRLGNFALVGGKRVNVVGGVCMDQCMVQLDSLPEARPGDEVVLVGRQGEAVITADEVGEAWGSINYDVVCGLTARVPRIYLNE
jgi:alanine racemase